MPDLVSRSDDGRKVMVLGDDGFAGSLVDGEWTPRILFSADELKDFFSRVTDPSDVAAWSKKARTALPDCPVLSK